MPDYQTKLKVGRKLEGVDSETASRNRASALLRFEEDGSEDHVSFTIESDAMGPDDVFAVFNLLEDRGILSAHDAKTWLHQSKASKDEHGPSTTWQGTDVQEKMKMLRKGLTVRGGRSDGPDPQARNKQALLRLGEVQERLDEVRQTLKGNEAPGSGADAEAD